MTKEKPLEIYNKSTVHIEVVNATPVAITHDTRGIKKTIVVVLRNGQIIQREIITDISKNVSAGQII